MAKEVKWENLGGEIREYYNNRYCRQSSRIIEDEEDDDGYMSWYDEDDDLSDGEDALFWGNAYNDFLTYRENDIDIDMDIKDMFRKALSSIDNEYSSNENKKKKSGRTVKKVKKDVPINNRFDILDLND